MCVFVYLMFEKYYFGYGMIVLVIVDVIENLVICEDERNELNLFLCII